MAETEKAEAGTPDLSTFVTQEAQAIVLGDRDFLQANKSKDEKRREREEARKSLRRKACGQKQISRKKQKRRDMAMLRREDNAEKLAAMREIAGQKLSEEESKLLEATWNLAKGKTKKDAARLAYAKVKAGIGSDEDKKLVLAGEGYDEKKYKLVMGDEPSDGEEGKGADGGDVEMKGKNDETGLGSEGGTSEENEDKSESEKEEKAVNLLEDTNTARKVARSKILALNMNRERQKKRKTVEINLNRKKVPRAIRCALPSRIRTIDTEKQSEHVNNTTGTGESIQVSSQSSKVEKLQQDRLNLPIVQQEGIIIDMLSQSDIIAVTGEPGCGKSTQVPQFLIEAGYGGTSLGEDDKREFCEPRDGLVMVSEPRRIAATSLARRVSDELGVVLGQQVGYKIRFESRSSTQSSLVFCTHGVLLRLIQADNTLSSISCVIIDEAHERSTEGDLVIGYVCAISRARRQQWNAGKSTISPLKVILMSATLDPELIACPSPLFPKQPGPPVINIPTRQHAIITQYVSAFSAHWKEAEEREQQRRLGITESNSKSRVQEIDGAEPVPTGYKYLDDIVMFLKHLHRTLPPGHMLVFLPGAGEINYVCKKLQCVEENKEGSEDENEDIQLRSNRKEYADMDSSDDDGANNYGDRSESSDVAFDDESEKVWFDKTKLNPTHQLLMNVMNGNKVDEPNHQEDTQTHGGKLNSKKHTKPNKQSSATSEVQMTNVDDKEEAKVVLEEALGIREAMSGGVPVTSVRQQLDIYPLYASMSDVEQKKVFALPRPDSRAPRAVVIATNIAESAVTVGGSDGEQSWGVRYVIDSGLGRTRIWSSSAASALVTGQISRASAEQRAGRAGRCGPGHCFRLYPISKFVSFLPHAVPDIVKGGGGLDSVILTLASAGITQVGAFPFPKAPNPITLRGALASLVVLGLITREDGEDQELTRPNELLTVPLKVTQKGRLASILPLHPRHGAMMAAALSTINKTSGEADRRRLLLAIDLVSSLSIDGPLNKPQGKFLWLNGGSDALERIMAMHLCRKDREECIDVGLSVRIIDEMLSLSKQLRTTLRNNETFSVNFSWVPVEVGDLMLGDTDSGFLRQLLLVGYVDRIAQNTKRIFYKPVGDKEEVRLPADSILAKINPPPPLVTYTGIESLELLGKKTLRGATVISPSWLTKLAPLSLTIRSQKTQAEYNGERDRTEVVINVNYIGRASNIDDGIALGGVREEFPTKEQRKTLTPLEVGDTKVRCFAEALLKGEAFEELKRVRQNLVTPSDQIGVIWTSELVGLVSKLKGLGISNKASLLNVFKGETAKTSVVDLLKPCYSHSSHGLLKEVVRSLFKRGRR